MRPRWPLLFLPYTRNELPAWGSVLSFIHRTGWSEAPVVTTHGKWHGYEMRLDLSDWSDRMTYFLGRYYEFDVQLLLGALLREGDRFVDVGANTGMITLYAARRVGTTGRIDSFEPNPTPRARLREHLAMNGLAHVVVHPVALSDAPGRAVLRLTSSHTGTATLASVEGAIESVPVEVAVGDERLGPAPIRAIKIDVEGFELNVLRGLARTLRTQRPFVVLEFVEEQFARAGTTGREIAGFMRGLSYRPFGISQRRRMLRYELWLEPFLEGRDTAQNVLWVHDENMPTGVVGGVDFDALRTWAVPSIEAGEPVEPVAVRSGTKGSAA